MRALVGVVLSAFCLWVLPVTSFAAERILELAHWEDKSAAVTFEQLPRVADFKPYETILNKGFSDSAEWVRVKIAAKKVGEPDQLVLIIRPVYLDYIELYDSADNSVGQMKRVTGDTQPWQTSEFESIHHTFLIPALSQDRYVWFRFTSTSTHTFNVQALTPKEMMLQEGRLLHAYAALLAGLVAVLVLVVLAWVRDRDAIIGFFVLRQVVTLIYTASFLGYHRLIFHDVFEATTLDTFYSWIVLLMPGLTFIFEYRFLSLYKLPKWARALMWLITGLVCLAPIALSIGWVRPALQMSVAVVGLISVSIFVVALSIQTEQAEEKSNSVYLLPKYLICIYYGIIFFILIFFVLPTLGIIKASLWTVYGVLFYGVSSGLLMTALLIYRSQRTEDMRLYISNQLVRYQAELSAETHRRQDQSRLLSMLMHEIKTPLSVIDMAMAQLRTEQKVTSYVERAIANMKSILDRCVQTDRLLDGAFQLNVQPLNLSRKIQTWVDERIEGKQRFVLNLQTELLVNTDLQCLQIIVNNLIENAVKHGHPTEPISITLNVSKSKDVKSGVLIQIANSPGASDWPDAQKLFSKYYRSGAAQRQSGTGLGLYLSRNLAEKLGGSLRYRTNNLQIIFELWLPS